jgi:hypothetical protein
MLKRLYNWIIVEPFPLQLFFVLIVTHLIIRNLLENNQTFDLWYGILSQIFGGFVVLFNIDSNLKRHGGNNLIKQLIDWLLRCPFKKQNTIIKPHTAKMSVSSGLPIIFSIKRDFDSIEAKVDYIYEQILNWNKKMNTLREHIDDQCTEIEKSLNQKVEKIDQELKDHSKFISKSFTGNIKWELLGVLCIIYGIIIPLYV